MEEQLEGLDLFELLDLLEPVPEPVPVSWTPQTAGWIWLGLAVILAILFATRRLIRRYRKNAYRREALRELKTVSNDASEVAKLIRRSALVAFPRADVAALTGEAWLSFLNGSYPGPSLQGQSAETLLTAPYRPVTADAGLAEFARDWISRHRSGKAGA